MTTRELRAVSVTSDKADSNRGCQCSRQTDVLLWRAVDFQLPSPNDDYIQSPDISVNDIMFPALQPHRPQINALQSKVPNPQIRNIQSPSGSPTVPRNQIEAMPPFVPTNGAPKLPMMHMHEPLFNSATLHPVFFTQSLRKPPFPLPHGTSSSASSNPAAFGYIAETSTRNTALTSKTKL